MAEKSGLPFSGVPAAEMQGDFFNILPKYEGIQRYPLLHVSAKMGTVSHSCWSGEAKMEQMDTTALKIARRFSASAMTSPSLVDDYGEIEVWECDRCF